MRIPALEIIGESTIYIYIYMKNIVILTIYNAIYILY